MIYITYVVKRIQIDAQGEMLNKKQMFNLLYKSAYNACMCLNHVFPVKSRIYYFVHDIMRL